MPTIESLTREECEGMSPEQKKEYCSWCWDKTFASCPDCLIEIERKSKPVVN